MVPHFSQVLGEVGILNLDGPTGLSRLAHLSRTVTIPCMRIVPALLLIVCCSLTACNKSSNAPSSSSAASSKPPDAVQQKLQDFAGSSATNCGRLDVKATADQSKAASDCAMQASQNKRPFSIAYDMPGMTVGVAGNSEG